MRFTLDETTYEVTIPPLSIAEARAVKRRTGLTAAQLQLTPMIDPDASAAVLWLAKRRAGETVDWDEIEEIDQYAFIASIEPGPAEASADDEGDENVLGADAPPNDPADPHDEPSANGEVPALTPATA